MVVENRNAVNVDVLPTACLRCKTSQLYANGDGGMECHACGEVYWRTVTVAELMAQYARANGSTNGKAPSTAPSMTPGDRPLTKQQRKADCRMGDDIVWLLSVNGGMNREALRKRFALTGDRELRLDRVLAALVADGRITQPPPSGDEYASPPAPVPEQHGAEGRPQCPKAS